MREPREPFNLDDNSKVYLLVTVVPRAEQGDALTKDELSDPTRAGSKDEEREIPRVLVQTLLRGRREIILEHNGQDYRLRVTASGKLILTK